MDSNKYQELAMLTESPVGIKTAERFMQNAREYNFLMDKLYECLSELDFDKMKRTIFYGEPGDLIEPEEVKELRLVHGLLGKITELYELIELIRENDEIDPVHLKEELGDGRWYDALIASSQNVELSQVDSANIAKLAFRNRNKGKFDLAGTLERELEKEKEILSGSLKVDEDIISQKQLQGYNSEKLTEDLGCSIKK